jgi:enoyl-CoA hydratase/carnithine racemase
MKSEEALRWGLVSELAPPGTVLDLARRYADEMMKCSPLALRYTKELAPAVMEGDRMTALIANGRKTVGPVQRGLADTKEGVDAFIGKRKPVWQGR